MRPSRFIVRNTQPSDFDDMIELCQQVYVDCPPWAKAQLSSHLEVFPEGQLVILDRASGKLVGFAGCLIVRWHDYKWETPWRHFTDHGMFTNHDPENGRTLYGAEIMIHPSVQGTGAGTHLYKEREKLARRLGLLRIRAGARLRGYHRYAARMAPEEYVRRVIQKKISDPTLSFQLRRGFHVLRVVAGYLKHDPESLGYAAVIEWINPDVATPDDYRNQQESEFHLDQPVSK